MCGRLFCDAFCCCCCRCFCSCSILVLVFDLVLVLVAAFDTIDTFYKVDAADTVDTVAGYVC